MMAVFLAFPGVAIAATANYERTARQLSEAIDTATHLAQDEQPYDVVFCRDPMQPLVNDQGDIVFSSGLHGGLSAQGIVWSESRPLVIVDDEVLAKGSAVGPYTIVDIQPDGVIVERDGQRMFVPLDRGLAPPQAKALDAQPAAAAP